MKHTNGKEQAAYWTPDKPVSELPKGIRDLFVQYAVYLRNDLRENRLAIGLMPARDPAHHGHKEHIVVATNPPWYSSLYEAYRYRTRTNQGRWRGKGYVKNKGKRVIVHKRRRAVKRFQSKIQRSRVMDALEQIVQLADQPFAEQRRGCMPYCYWYHRLMRSLIYEHLAEGFVAQDSYVPPNKRIAAYFANGHEARDRPKGKGRNVFAKKTTRTLEEIPF